MLDGTITARVVSQQDTGEWAKAGVMVKAAAEFGAPYVAMLVTPDHGVRFQADFTTDASGGASGTPVWLRLTRAGTTITGYTSADGTTWRQVGSTKLAGLPAAVEVGMFANSPSTGVQVVRRGGSTAASPDYTPSTATFDSVSLTPGPAGRWTSEDIGGSIRMLDGSVLAGSAAESGGTFTVTGIGDIREIPFAELGDDDIVQNTVKSG